MATAAGGLPAGARAATGSGDGEAVPALAALKAACALHVDGVTAEVVAALDRAGIPSILLKGPSIARWLYPPGARTYSDTDLLVPPRDFARAGSVLRSRGFTELFEGFDPSERNAGSVETPFTRAPVPGVRAGGKVDLHRNLPHLPTPDAVLWETLDARCETMRVGDAQVRVLDHTGVALHVVVHALQHAYAGHTGEDLRRAVGALALDGWHEVALLAERLGISGVLGLGLRGHPDGAELAERLGLPQLDLEDSGYSSNAAWAPRGARALSRLRAAPSARDKATIVRRALLPSRAKVSFLSGDDPARGRAVLAGYLRYWRGLPASIGPAARFVRDRTRPQSGAAGGTGPSRRAVARDSPLLLEAGLCLAGARLAVAVLPFGWVTRALRQRVGESDAADDPATLRQQRRVAWALRSVARRTPGGRHCLAQALAGKHMLRRRRIASTLYLGVAGGAHTPFEAHAWLRSGSLTVTGGNDLDRFAVIATFCDDRDRA